MGVTPTDVTIADVEAAWERIRGRVRWTPVQTSTRLGQRIGVELLLKSEHLQRTGSFKVRGGLNKVINLTPDERERGVIAVSAGNHAQGVAWAAATLDVRSVIVMPREATEAKVAATQGYGAEVVLVDGGISGAFEQVKRLQAEGGMTLIHPFDDPHVIAGQGSVGLEIVEDVPDVDVIVAGIGGGGLISGTALAARARHPGVRVIGVEPAGAAVMRKSWDAGGPLEMIPRTIADGLASPVAGDLTYRLTRAYVDDIVTVTDEEIVSALKDLLVYCKLYAEPAGAASVAALLSGKLTLAPGSKVVAIVSGGNFDLDALQRIL